MNKGIQRIFNQVANRYQLTNHVLTFGLDIFWRKTAAKLCRNLQENFSVLDLCSGTGDLAFEIYNRKGKDKDTRIVCLDFAWNMLKQLKIKADGKLSLVMADAEQLPFLSGIFDLVTISFASRNLNFSTQILENTFKEIKRVLKPGGYFVNLETTQPESKLIKIMLAYYLKYFVRIIGWLLSGSRAGYRYLVHTIPRFYGKEEFASFIKRAGFKRVSFKTLFPFGIVAIHVAKNQ